MLALLLLFLAPMLFATPPVSEPALSPDHREMLFVSGGDIWTAPANGGEARLLVSNPATESHPLFSPDGERVAFVSTRTGAGDIYVLELRTGDLRRITFDDTRAALDAWSPDGKFLYFTSSRADVGSMGDIYRVPAMGGTPVAISAERYVDESQAAPNPVDGSVAFVNGSMAVSQWWRKGHAHIDETRIVVLSAAGKYQTILENHAKNLWPMWMPSGRELYFVSDASGAENLWKMTPGATPRQVTSFKDGRVLWPSIARDGKAIVFERDFQAWKLDTATGKAAPVEIALRGVPAGPSSTHLTLTSGFRDLVLSSDGKKLAFTAHGDVFAVSANDGGNAVRLTQTAENETDLAWSPDGKQLVYVSDRDGSDHLYLYDLAAEKETRLTSDAANDSKPAWSPDGARLAWVRDRREIHVMTLAGKSDRVIVSRKYRTLTDADRPISWSPDGEWIALFDSDERAFENVSAVPAAGGAERPLSFIANTNGGGIAWSPDHSYLLFDSGQRTEQRWISRVDLVPRTPTFREDAFRDLFRDPPPNSATLGLRENPDSKESPKEKKQVQIAFEGIRDRLARLPLGLDARSPVISPDGKTLLFTAASGGQENLYTYSLDPMVREAVARQLTSTAGRKDRAQFSPDGKQIFYLENGRINVVPIENRAVHLLAVTAELDVSFDLEKKEMFRQAWRTLNETYYDPDFHGVNWTAIRDRYAPVVDASRTPDEVRRVIGLMIGEMNSSHSGISAGAAGVRTPTTGRLGLAFDPVDGSVVSVTPLGPAAIAGIAPGEKLLAVNGTEITPATSLDELLQYRIGRRTLITTSAKKDVPVLPINTTTEKRLLYRAWVEDRRAYVDKISQGRLGYVHMIDMSAASLDQLYLDLDAENQSREGVVIDIRNNTGGFVNAYALDVFARRPYLTMTERDHPAGPARTALGQRAFERPTVLVVNQNSLSDAEDFTEGYRTLKLGKVVGLPTAGWIIYTDSATLIDGSSLRTPMIKITANDGTDMELHPRPVDVKVETAPGDGLAGRDLQLDAAVKTLVGELGAKPVGSR